MTSYVADLEDRSIAEAFLDLQVVVEEVRRPEILACGVHIVRVGASAESRAGRDPGEDRCTAELCLSRSGTPVVSVQAVVIDRMRANWVVLQAIRSANRRPKIEEWIHVDLIEKDANSAADNEILSVRWLVGEPDTRSEVVLVRRKDRIDAISLDLKSFPDHKHCQVFVRTVKRPDVLIAKTKVYVQLGGQLPLILSEKIEPIDAHEAFGIADGNRRSGDVAREKIR